MVLAQLSRGRIHVEYQDIPEQCGHGRHQLLTRTGMYDRGGERWAHRWRRRCPRRNGHCTPGGCSVGRPGQRCRDGALVHSTLGFLPHL